MKQVDDAEMLEKLLTESPISVLYFSGRSCGVCQALCPRIEALFAEDLPRVPLLEVATDEQPKLAARYSVFNLPVLIIHIDGREGPRLAHTFYLHGWTVYRRARRQRAGSLGEVHEAIERPDNLLFG